MQSNSRIDYVLKSIRLNLFSIEISFIDSTFYGKSESLNN